MRNRTVPMQRAIGGAMLAAIGSVVGLPAAVLAAPPPITFSVFLNTPGECFAVFNSANRPITVTLRAASGELKAQATLPADEPFVCIPQSVSVLSGDRIRATDGTYTRKWTVPPLSVHVDRVEDIFSGTGPAGRTLNLQWISPLGDAATLVPVRVDSNGNWRKATSSDLIGGTQASLRWKSPNGDAVFVNGEAPYLTLTLDKARFTGRTEPFADVMVSVRNGVLSAGTTTADGHRSFAGQFRRSGGQLAPIKAGDRVSAPSLAADLNWVMPNIEATGDAATDIVSGRCQPTASYSNTLIVEVRRDGHLRGNVIGFSADGSFSIDFERPNDWEGTWVYDEANVKHGDAIFVRCMQVTGDWAQARIVVS